MCAVVNSIKRVVCVPSSFHPHDAKTPRSPLVRGKGAGTAQIARDELGGGMPKFWSWRASTSSSLVLTRPCLAPAEKGARGLCALLCPGFWEGFLAQEQCQACAGSVPRRGTAPGLINPAALRLAEGRVNVVVSPYAASLICNPDKGSPGNQGRSRRFTRFWSLVRCAHLHQLATAVLSPLLRHLWAFFFHVFPPLNSRVNT